MGNRGYYLNERGVLQYGWTSLHGLSVWITTHSYSQYCQTIEQLGMTLGESPLVVPIDTIRKAMSRPTYPAQRDQFRILQVFNHECSHFRALCGTSAGALTYALASRRMLAIRQTVCTLVRHRLQNGALKGFLPLGPLAVEDPLQRGTLGARSPHVTVAPRDAAKALSFWLSAGRRDPADASVTPVFLSACSDATRHFFNSTEFGPAALQGPNNTVANSGLTLGNLVEAQARLFDFALSTAMASPPFRASLLEELCAHPDYVAAWEYLHRGCHDATFMDLAFCLDLALMPPIFVQSRMKPKTVKWPDIHPVLRFERIVKELPSLPRITTDFRNSYMDSATRICEAVGWPLPWEVFADHDKEQDIAPGPTDAAQRYMRNRVKEAATLRTTDRSFLAWPWAGENLAGLGGLNPPLQFWKDGLTWGVRLPLMEGYGLMKVALADALSTDCVTARSPRTFLALWRRMSDGLAAELTRRADQGMIGEVVDEGFSSLPDKVCEELFGVSLSYLRRCWA
jgi:hypothetical protein